MPEALRAAVAVTPRPALDAAMAREVVARTEAFVAGIEAYRAHPYRRGAIDPPVLWQEGSSTLFDHGGDGAALLLVPSLINRGYVLDLDEETSLARYLASNGARVMRLEWGAPTDAERAYDIASYVARLLRALASLPGPVRLLGYCMGGLFAVAAACLAPARIEALALLATPWDFHQGVAATGGVSRAETVAAIYRAAADLIERTGALPVDAIQALFTWLDPLGAARKFARFAALDPASREAHSFVALEDWLNDGVALVPGVARDAMQGWYGDNRPARGDWTLDGITIDPTTISVPTLLVLPQGDRIVPPASARSLATRVPGATVRDVPLGHIGMVVGARAPTLVWQPLAAWLAGQA